MCVCNYIVLYLDFLFKVLVMLMFLSLLVDEQIQTHVKCLRFCRFRKQCCVIDSDDFMSRACLLACRH